MFAQDRAHSGGEQNNTTVSIAQPAQPVNNGYVRALRELQPGKQWVCFDKEKTPLNPAGGSVQGELVAGNPTWGTYQQALDAWKNNPQRYAGIGREFVREQKITGVDLDHCIDEQGQIAEWARAEVRRLNSYTETSPSGHGLHIWVHGVIPNNLSPSKPSPDGYEMYDHARYFTFTGKHLVGTPETIEDRQVQLLDLHKEVSARREQVKRQAEAKKQPSARRAAVAQSGDTPYGMAALERECADMREAGDGSRNDQLNRSAFSLGQLVAGGELTRNTAEMQLFTAAASVGLDEREIEKTMYSGIESGLHKPRSAPEKDSSLDLTSITVDTPIVASNGHKGYGSPPISVSGNDDLGAQFIIGCLNENEWGDSLLFARLFRGKAVYDHIEKIWYLYRVHWTRDDTNKIYGYVSGILANVYFRTAGALVERARKGGIQQEIDEAEKHAKALTKRAHELKSVARCRNILVFAAGQDGMGIIAKEWDTNKWLLGVPNGVLDLKTGEFRDGLPQDYIRTICPTEWHGINAPAPRFEQFLQEIFEDRMENEIAETIDFLQRFLGGGITGETRDHVFGVFYGEDGRNGKDTLQRALTCTLGEVSGAISKDVFLDVGKQHSAGGATPHLCDLQGKRLAWASEPEKGARFNIGQVKELSGGGEIPVRPLYAKDYFKIQPTHLLILLTNHKPHADANDNAFWDRLRLITFNMRFVDNPEPETRERKKDTALWDKLEQEAPGILAWLVRGCLEWQKEGLNTPQCIIDAANAYRKEEDVIADFLNEQCDTSNPGSLTLAGAIYTAYEMWCGKGYKLNRTAFGRLLSKRFEKTEKTRNGIYYKGIRLISPLQTSQPTLFGQTVTSSQNYSHASETASEADLDGQKEESCEQCERFSQKVSLTRENEFSIELLSKKTIHTSHSPQENIEKDQPVEPLKGTVTSSQNYSRQQSENERAAQALLVEITAQGCSLHPEENRRWGIRVPDEWTDEQYEALVKRVLALDVELRQVMQNGDSHAA